MTGTGLILDFNSYLFPLPPRSVIVRLRLPSLCRGITYPSLANQTAASFWLLELIEGRGDMT